MGQRVLTPHDGRGTQMQRPPALCPEAGAHRLADEQMQEGHPPARRRLLLDQDSGPLGLAERSRRSRRARHRSHIDQRAVIPEHRRGRHHVTRSRRKGSQPELDHFGQRPGRTHQPAGIVQRIVGQFSQKRPGEQRVAARVLPESPERPVREPSAPKGPAQHPNLVHLEPGERKPGTAAIAAHEALPPLAQLGHPARPARQDHQHTVGAQPPAGEQKGTRGRQVHPLQVLDHHGDRLALLHRGEQGQQLHADPQRIRVRPRTLAEQLQAGQRPGRNGSRPRRQLLHHTIGQERLSLLAAGGNDRHAPLAVKELGNKR